VVLQASEGVDGPWWLQASAPFQDLVAVHARDMAEATREEVEGRAALVAAEAIAVAVDTEVGEATVEEEVVVEAEVEAIVAGAEVVVRPLQVVAVTAEKDDTRLIRD